MENPGSRLGHTSTVGSTSFDHTGHCIVSASGNRTLRVWDAQFRECQQTVHAVPAQGYATYRGNELIAAAGPAWRYLCWYAPNERGEVMPHAFESRLTEEQRSWLDYR